MSTIKHLSQEEIKEINKSWAAIYKSENYRNEFTGWHSPEFIQFSIPLAPLKEFIFEHLEPLGIKKSQIEVYKIDHQKGYGCHIHFDKNKKPIYASVDSSKIKSIPCQEAVNIAANNLAKEIVVAIENEMRGKK